MSLEVKLKEVLTLNLPGGATYELDETDKTVAQIIQAFKDDNWYKFEGKTLMTGQGWYDRWVKEFDHEKIEHDGNPDRAVTLTVMAALKAAKRSAGL